MKARSYVLMVLLGGLATAVACSDDATGTGAQGGGTTSSTGAGGNPQTSTGALSGGGKWGRRGDGDGDGVHEHRASAADRDRRVSGHGLRVRRPHRQRQ